MFMCSNLLKDDSEFNHHTARKTATQRKLKSYDTEVRISPIFSVRRHKVSSGLIRRREKERDK